MQASLVIQIVQTRYKIAEKYHSNTRKIKQKKRIIKHENALNLIDFNKWLMYTRKQLVNNI